MSFLRNIRNNLTNNGHSNNYRNSKPVKLPRSIINERNTIDRNGLDSERERYGTNRRDSGTGRRDSSTTTLMRESKYGRESPAPIIVYVDKYETATTKKPTGILRKNTFTKGDREETRRSTNAISRSDTFTINESEDEKTRTSTYTKKKNKDKPSENVFYPLYSKNIELTSEENIPVVVDTRTFRKKSLKSSKPVQKVESFIKRFEKTLFKHDSKKNVRKDSNSSEGTYVPQFRDIGINCKLDEEEKLKTATRKKKSGSRDSLLETVNPEHSSSTYKSYRERSSTPQTRNRARSASPTKRYSTYPTEARHRRDEPPIAPDRSHKTRDRSSSPFETFELKSKSADKSYLKARQKEAEMGYSTVNKKIQSRSPDHNKSVIVNASRTERIDPDRGRSFTVTTSTHRAEFDRPPQFRSDTYNTLKEEYEQANRKPVGIASPRLSSDRPAKPTGHLQSPSKQTRKDSAELPKYTFGTNLQETRSRFQQFQKSFKKMDENSSEVTVQQSFFVPI